MKRIIIAILAVICLQGNVMAKTKTVKLRIIETSDVHGCFFPYDYINRRPMKGSMARVSTYLKELRKTYGDNLLLFDVIIVIM